MTAYRILWVLLCCALAGRAGASGVSLTSGIVVDPEQRSAWVAAPEGRVAAVDLGDGSLRWNGPALGHPLARLQPGLLVALQPEERGVWPLAWVDPQTGAVGERFSAILPAEVLASLEALPNQRFEAFVVAVEGGVELHWFSQRWAFRGARLEDDDGVSTHEGVVRVDAAASRAITMATAPRRPRIDLDASERIAGLAEPQLRSADDQHLLQRTPIADDTLGQRWEWQIHRRSNGAPMASLRLPEAAAPWLIDRDRLLWVSRPMIVKDASGTLIELPARLIAMGLSDSAELWSVALRDPVFRGTLPP
ncbi:MAG: hypothetical protein MUE46_00535 [Xanthomonadales bacterium]|jgi:hypothetical protein|nr:hypothetical protein [Xanthomonadales bacterium]